jgi:hypothetical protein
MLSDGHSKVTFGKQEFTYDNRDKAEMVEWTEKRIDEEICIYLQRHLEARSITPSDMEGCKLSWEETMETQLFSSAHQYLFN